MKKKLMIGIVTTMIMLSSSLAFAIPNNTLVLGDKAFEIQTLFDNKYETELNDALSNANGVYYYNMEGSTNGFVDLFKNTTMTDAIKATLTNIELRKADGSLWKYSTFDTTAPTEVEGGSSTEDFKVEDIY